MCIVFGGWKSSLFFRNLGVVMDIVKLYWPHCQNDPVLQIHSFYLENHTFPTGACYTNMIQSFVLSRLDNCNAFLPPFQHAPSYVHRWSRMWQNNKLKRVHITPLFISLHWLPVFNSKLCSLQENPGLLHYT